MPIKEDQEGHYVWKCALCETEVHFNSQDGILQAIEHIEFHLTQLNYRIVRNTEITDWQRPIGGAEYTGDKTA